MNISKLGQGILIKCEDILNQYNNSNVIEIYSLRFIREMLKWNWHLSDFIYSNLICKLLLLFYILNFFNVLKNIWVRFWSLRTWNYVYYIKISSSSLRMTLDLPQNSPLSPTIEHCISPDNNWHFSQISFYLILPSIVWSS